MSDAAIAAQAAVRVLWEFATYRWVGDPNYLRSAWQLTFQEPMPWQADFALDGPARFELYRHADGPRFVIYKPHKGTAEIRALDTKSRNALIARTLQPILEKCARALGTTLDVGRVQL